jgi:hypothetical protein
MRKYELIGITNYAKQYLCEEDIQSLLEMIGCTVVERETKSILYGKKMFQFPNGEELPIDFVELEEIQPELDFEVKENQTIFNEMLEFLRTILASENTPLVHRKRAKQLIKKATEL